MKEGPGIGIKELRARSRACDINPRPRGKTWLPLFKAETEQAKPDKQQEELKDENDDG